MSTTRERLLDAAGEVFAEKGFHAASVREICERAGANLASVNYHFRSKEKLYEAVVLHTFDYAMEKFPVEVDREGLDSPEERLFVFIHRFLLRLLDRDRPGWHIKVLRREHAEPGPALRAVVRKIIRRNREQLLSILTDLIGAKADQERLQLCASSIAGQCLFYHRARPIVFPSHGRVDYSSSGIEKLARHITDFSLAAIRNMAKAKNAREPKSHRRAKK
jgi:AcrR family transcriptional regulator